MPDLRRDSLHAPNLPLGYLPLVRLLDRFIEDSLELRPRKALAEPWETEELEQQHDELMSAALALFGRGVDSDVPDARRAFGLGLYRCAYYKETVLSEPPLVDTCGSLTLTDFEVDTAQGPAARAAFRAFLQSDLGFDDADLAQLDAQLGPEIEALRFRQQLMHALDERHPLSRASSDDDTIWALFGELYPGHPFRPGEIDVVRTSTSVFFCLPFDDELRMTTPNWAERSDSEREAVRTFLRRWSKFKQRYYAHFPVFGFFRGEDVAPALLEHLAERTGSRVEAVSDALTTMVSILQSRDLDKYIVHDAWGHHWQSLLFRFEETYRHVASYESLPNLDWRPEAGGPTLGEVVRLGIVEGAEAALGRWEEYVRAVVDDRLLQSLAGLVAEVLADVVEYKFILLRPDDAGDLLSSSFFKERPTKLDLTLWDLPWYFKLALRSLERLVQRDAVRDELCAAFDEADPRRVRAVVDAFAERTGELLDFDFRRSLHYEVVDEMLHVNAFCRVALSFLALQATFNDLYDRLREEPPPPRAEIRRFHDVLVFATASFVELDWHEHFWLIDEFLGTHFIPLWEVLRGHP